MSKYKFTNKLMFAIVMHDPIACKKFIEIIFPERKVEKISFPGQMSADAQSTTIGKIAAEIEKTIITGFASKSVRLDVLFKGDDTIYDIEMQVESEEAIAKRSRYYHMAIARNSLKKGETYDKLKTGYVIFVCCFDPFKRKEPIYRFEMYDKNLQLQLGDGSSTIILNTKCPKGKIPKTFEAFYNFVNTGEVDEKDEFVKYLGERVEEANEDEEVDRIMTLEEELTVRYNRGLSKGLEEGRKQAEEEKRKIAKNCKQLGLTSAQIAEATGLEIAEVEAL